MSGLATFKDGEQVTCDTCGSVLWLHGSFDIDLTYIAALDRDVELIVGCENCPPYSSELLEAQRVLELLAKQCGRCGGEGSISSEDIEGAREQWERFKERPFEPIDVSCPSCATYRSAAVKLAAEVQGEAE